MIKTNGQFRFVLTPKDFAASDRFYRQGLGLGVDHEWDYGGGDQGVVFYAGGGMVELLGLLPGHDYVAPQGASILVEVEDADEAFRAVTERGLEVVQPPTTFPWGHRVLRLKDPDGVLVSLFSPVEAAH